MFNFFSMKQYFLVILFFFSIILKSQNITNIAPFSQQRNQWCWAACMQIVLKKHNPSLDIKQCTLAQLYLNEINYDRVLPKVKCLSCDECKPTFFSDNCNKPITDTFFRPLFRNFNFQSDFTDGTLNALSWVSISNQMIQGLPIIMTVKTGVGDCTSNHAVVAYGVDSVGGKIEYINPKNPYKTATCESLSEKIIYTVPYSSGILPKVCRFFYDIKLRTVNGIIARSIVNDTTNEEKIVNRTIETGLILLDTVSFRGEIKKNLKPDEFLTYSNSSDYITLPVKYVSSSKILNNPINVSKLKKIEEEGIVYDFIYTKYPYTVTSLQKVGSQWIPIIVSFFQPGEAFSATYGNGKKVFLSKKASGFTPESYVFDGIVKYPELGYAFMQLKKSGISYLVPLGDYEDIKVADSIAKSGIFYKEILIVKEIQNNARANIVFSLQKQNPKK